MPCMHAKLKINVCKAVKIIKKTQQKKKISKIIE